MTDLARLGIELDSRQVKEGTADLDRLTTAGQKAEKATQDLANEMARSKRDVAAWRAEVRAGALSEEQFAKNALASRQALKAAQSEYNAAQSALSKFSASNDNVGKASGLAAHHVQNLAFQANDLFVGLASGQKPMTVFIQQGAQIGQIAMQAGMGFGAMAKQIGAMTVAFVAANPVILGIAAAGGAVAAAFAIVTDEINKTSAVTVTWQDVALGAMDAVKAYATGELTKAFESIGISAEDAWGKTMYAAKTALDFLIGYGTLPHRMIIAAFQTFPAALGDIFYSGVNLAITAINKLVEKSVQAVNFFARQANKILPDDMQIGGLETPQIGGVGNPYAGGLGRALAAGGRTLADTWAGGYIDAGANYLKPFAEARALLNEEAKKAGHEAGKAGGKAAADAFADTFNKALDSVFAAVDKQMQAYWENYPKQTEAELAAIKAQSAAAFEQVYKNLNKAHEGSVAFNEELRATIGYLDRIGGIGSTLADLGGVFLTLKTGERGLTRGPIGILAETFQKSFPAFSEKIVMGFDKVLQSVFGRNGSFTNLLQGAGTGTAMGQLLFGDNKGAQIGGAIGGALGSLLGPIGNVVGSIIGSTLGKLLGGGAKYGSAVVGANGVSVGGNNDNSKGAATGAGGAVSDAISQIAQALGGTVGNYAVSIGETDGKWRISTSGRSGELKSKYSDVQVFGKGDAAAEAALKAAIADAIKDGAIQGVSAAVGRLLQSGGDIDKQVQKAQLFQAVFTELKAQTDPLGSALDDLGKQFETLKGIFGEAGASAEEYASLEQLLALKRQDAIDAARQANVDKISDQFNLQIRALELMGKGESALAATRLLELAGLKDTLQPIQRMVYELEDARAVIDQFAPLADGLREYRKELLGTSSVASLGAARALFSATAASAAMGDAAALGNLRGVSTSFLDSAKANARSSLDYNRARGQVLSAVDQGIFAADTKVDYAQAQIDAINNSAQILEQMRAEMASLQGQIASNTAYMANLWKRFDGEGMTIRTDADQPLQVEIAA